MKRISPSWPLNARKAGPRRSIARCPTHPSPRCATCPGRVRPAPRASVSPSRRLRDQLRQAHSLPITVLSRPTPHPATRLRSVGRRPRTVGRANPDLVADLSANQSLTSPAAYLLRDLVIDQPNQVWAADKSMVHTAGQVFCNDTVRHPSRRTNCAKHSWQSRSINIQ